MVLSLVATTLTVLPVVIIKWQPLAGVYSHLWERYPSRDRIGRTGTGKHCILSFWMIGMSPVSQYNLSYGICRHWDRATKSHIPVLWGIWWFTHDGCQRLHSLGLLGNCWWCLHWPPLSSTSQAAHDSIRSLCLSPWRLPRRKWVYSHKSRLAMVKQSFNTEYNEIFGWVRRVYQLLPSLKKVNTPNIQTKDSCYFASNHKRRHLIWRVHDWRRFPKRQLGWVLSRSHWCKPSKQSQSLWGSQPRCRWMDYMAHRTVHPAKATTVETGCDHIVCWTQRHIDFCTHALQRIVSPLATTILECFCQTTQLSSTVSSSQVHPLCQSGEPTTKGGCPHRRCKIQLGIHHSTISRHTDNLGPEGLSPEPDYFYNQMMQDL